MDFFSAGEMAGMGIGIAVTTGLNKAAAFRSAPKAEKPRAVISSLHPLLEAISENASQRSGNRGVDSKRLRFGLRGSGWQGLGQSGGD